MFNDDNLSGKKKTVIQDIYPDIPADKNTLEMISWLQDDFVRPSLIAHFNKLKIIHKEYFAEIIKEKEENSL